MLQMIRRCVACVPFDEHGLFWRFATLIYAAIVD
jgi:hypothetical protein